MLRVSEAGRPLPPGADEKRGRRRDWGRNRRHAQPWPSRARGRRAAEQRSTSTTSVSDQSPGDPPTTSEAAHEESQISVRLEAHAAAEGRLGAWTPRTRARVPRRRVLPLRQRAYMNACAHCARAAGADGTESESEVVFVVPARSPRAGRRQPRRQTGTVRHGRPRRLATPREEAASSRAVLRRDPPMPPSTRAGSRWRRLRGHRRVAQGNARILASPRAWAWRNSTRLSGAPLLGRPRAARLQTRHHRRCHVTPSWATRDGDEGRSLRGPV